MLANMMESGYCPENYKMEPNPPFPLIIAKDLSTERRHHRLSGYDVKAISSPFLDLRNGGT